MKRTKTVMAETNNAKVVIKIEVVSRDLTRWETDGLASRLASQTMRSMAEISNLFSPHLSDIKVK